MSMSITSANILYSFIPTTHKDTCTHTTQFILSHSRSFANKFLRFASFTVGIFCVILPLSLRAKAPCSTYPSHSW